MNSWQALVTAATVGIAQRPPSDAVLSSAAGEHADLLDADPAGALLAAAALVDAGRRSGGLLPVVVALPAPAPDEDRPEASAAARLALRGLVGRNEPDLTREALAAMADAGVRAAAPDLPALLGLGATNVALRPAVAAILGERGRWLALQRPEWVPVVDARASGLPDDVWTTGRPGQRRAWLADLRRRDPDAARDTLAADWARENGDDRTRLIGVLREGLAAADEPFLERALDDGKAEVRERARALLSRLPSSAFRARAAARAEGVLRVERRGLRRHLVVVAPPPPDAAGLRDGLVPNAPIPAMGRQAWHLTQVISRAPLAVWAPLGEPSTLVALAVEGDFGAEVHTGWRLAAGKQGDAAWAAALLTQPAPSRLAPPDEQLVALLPAPERVARAIAALATPQGRTPPASDLAGCPVPWPEPLTDAVLDAFAARLRMPVPGTPGPALAGFGRCIALEHGPRRVDELRTLADRMRARAVDVPAVSRWVAPLDRAAEVLALRARLRTALLQTTVPPSNPETAP